LRDGAGGHGRASGLLSLSGTRWCGARPAAPGTGRTSSRPDAEVRTLRQADHHQLLRRTGVVDPGHVLLDDGALVEVAGDEVRCGPDLLHAARMGLPIGIG